MLKAVTIALGLFSATVANAEGGFFGLDGSRSVIGVGRIFNNDQFADGDDRWRSGSYSLSVVKGQGWDGTAPSRLGEILEYRLSSQIIAPRFLNGRGSGDRAYAGVLSLGAHTHFAAGPAMVSLGADLVLVGPQTGVIDLQDWFHGLFSFATVGDSVRANQVANAAHIAGTAEMSLPIRVGDRATLRPFVELQYGAEDIARVGADVILGPVGHSDLMIRDQITGHLYRAVEGNETGFGVILGADFAAVGESIYFPASFGTEAEDERIRARAGVHWQVAPEWSYFYGVTYLSEEYVGQPEGQYVGSIKLNFNF